MSRIYELKNKDCGFISPEELAEVVKESRLHPVLVRCGGCRFSAPAQDVKHLTDIINASGTDYVRDVSIQ